MQYNIRAAHGTCILPVPALTVIHMRKLSDLLRIVKNLDAHNLPAVREIASAIAFSVDPSWALTLKRPCF